MRTLEQLGISPAPWTVNKYDDVTTANGNIVACVEDWDVCDTAEVAVNARLIAAAPDLYDVCRRVIAWEDDVVVKRVQPPEKLNIIVAATRAALEKAGGAE